ncbi:hypothetical protein V8B55DRAFT_1012462 [Mucor lusitanicus]
MMYIQSPLFVLGFGFPSALVAPVPWITTTKNRNTKYTCLLLLQSLLHSHSTKSIGGISHVGHSTLFTPQSILANHFDTCWVGRERGREENWPNRRGGRVLRIWSSNTDNLQNTALCQPRDYIPVLPGDSQYHRLQMIESHEMLLLYIG